MKAKAFYNNVLSSEKDIFKGCKIVWIRFKEALLVGLLDATYKLEGQAVS